MKSEELAMDASDIEPLARRRAKAKIGWFIHLAAYLTVNSMLVVLSLATGHRWAIFPLLGWGVGLILHGASVWLFAPGSSMLERMVERERARLSGAKGDPW
jgi:hypothetical protein